MAFAIDLGVCGCDACRCDECRNVLAECSCVGCAGCGNAPEDCSCAWLAEQREEERREIAEDRREMEWMRRALR